MDFVRHRNGSVKTQSGAGRRLTKPPHTGDETHGIFRTLAVSVGALLHFYFDCFWLRHQAFRQVNLQHAVAKLSHDLGWVRILGQGESALKGAEEAFEPMEFFLPSRLCARRKCKECRFRLLL